MYNTHVEHCNYLPTCKKCLAPKKAILRNPRWQPRNGCDGRLIAKILQMTIQVNSVLNPSQAWRRQHKFSWIIVITIFAIDLPSQPFLGHHLGFTSFFTMAFLGTAHFFYSLAVFGLDYNYTTVVCPLTTTSAIIYLSVPSLS